MPLPIDATLKDLVQLFLHDYEVQMGLSDFGPFAPPWRPARPGRGY
jgi:hypothetical protein